MPIEIQCESCRKRYRVKDTLAGRTLPCKQCGEAMSVPTSEYGDDEWGDFDSEPAPAPALPKRRKSKKKSKKKSKSATPGIGKRIFAVIGMVFGVIIAVAGVWAIISGNMRGARGIGSGIVMFAVSLGWFRGTSDE